MFTAMQDLSFSNPPPHPNPKQTNKNKDIISMILSEKKRHIIISYLIFKKYSEQENSNKTIKPVYVVCYKLYSVIKKKKNCE